MAYVESLGRPMGITNAVYVSICLMVRVLIEMTGHLKYEIHLNLPYFVREVFPCASHI